MTTRVTEGARRYFYQFSEILSRLDAPAVLPAVCRNALVSETTYAEGGNMLTSITLLQLFYIWLLCNNDQQSAKVPPDVPSLACETKRFSSFIAVWGRFAASSEEKRLFSQPTLSLALQWFLTHTGFFLANWVNNHVAYEAHGQCVDCAWIIASCSLQCRRILWAHNLVAKAPRWNFPKRGGDGASQ